MRKILQETQVLGFDLILLRHGNKRRNHLLQLDYIKNQLIEKHGIYINIYPYYLGGFVSFVQKGNDMLIAENINSKSYFKSYKKGVNSAFEYIKEIADEN